MEQEKQPALTPIMTYFSVIRDPRIERSKLYPLYEVIVITILAVIALAQGWEDIERYAKAKKAWLSRFLKLEHGIPHHNLYQRVISQKEQRDHCDTGLVGETGAGRVHCAHRRERSKMT
jgi:hypothetical protein